MGVSEGKIVQGKATNRAMTHASTVDRNADRLDFGVVGKTVLAQFAADARLLEATERLRGNQGRAE